MKYGVAKHHVCMADGTVYTPGEVIPEGALEQLSAEKLRRLESLGALKVVASSDAEPEMKPEKKNEEPRDEETEEEPQDEETEAEPVDTQDIVEEAPARKQTRKKRGEA